MVDHRSFGALRTALAGRRAATGFVPETLACMAEQYRDERRRVPGGLLHRSGTRFEACFFVGRSMTSFASELDRPKVPVVSLRCSDHQPLNFSLGTGTTLLLRNDLLLGCRATTNKMMYKYISQLDDRVTWVKRARWVEDGRLLTTSGVSAGMDGALYLIAKRFGDEAASAIASYIEYSGNWQDGDEDPFEVAIEAK